MESLPDEYVDVASQITYTAKSDEIKSASENTAEAKAIAGGKDISEVFINPVPGARIETGPRSLQVRWCGLFIAAYAQFAVKKFYAECVMRDRSITSQQ